MGAKERNNRLQFGTSVPRWWIPAFNMTHRGGGGRARQQPPAGANAQGLAGLQRDIQRLERGRRLVSTVDAAARRAQPWWRRLLGLG